MIEIELVRVCAFKKKASVDGRKKLGCDRCGLAKSHPDHLGAPPSLNVFGSGSQFLFQQKKKDWERVLTAKLEAASLPRPCARILVEAEAVFPDRSRRDQGNFRFLLEKALGDALTAGGWLEDDDWTRYEFGNLTYAYEKGVSATCLMIFPLAHDQAAAA